MNNYDVRLDKDRTLQTANTHVYFPAKGDGTAVISSEDPCVIRRLLNASFFVEENRESHLFRGREIITYVDGRVPVGSVTIGVPRKSGGTARVVKAPRMVYNEAEKKRNRALMKKRLAGKDSALKKQD